MKLLKYQLITFLPELKASPKEINQALTLIGHFSSLIELPHSDYLFDLEIRQNRGDCLGYYGLCQDLSVYFHTPFKYHTPISLPESKTKTQITVTSKDVYRIRALNLSHIRNTKSPDWLKSLLNHHQINSINTLVDLTNYITLLYGLPCHAFDTHKSGESLIWENNRNYTKIQTLDKTKLTLHQDCLIISNEHEPLSLSFLGGSNCAVDLNTTDIILEMAIYNPTRVRQDSRRLKTMTEASIRLEKDLDTDTIPTAFNHLVDLICSHCQAKVTSQLFDYYPKPPVIPTVNFDPEKPSLFAGITIPTDKATDIITNLGCKLTGEAPVYSVTPPSFRKDIIQEEDLIEEVVRFYGYDKIPTDKPLINKDVQDITPAILKTIDNLKHYLVSQGYDEIRSWPLIKQSTLNHLLKLEPQYRSDQLVKTQNNINDLYPILRPSLIGSLIDQVTHYRDLQMPKPFHLFEIDKVFSKNKDDYQEKYTLCLFSSEKFNLDLPIQSLEVPFGYYAEINVNQINQTPKFNKSNQSFDSVVELKKQFATYDANIVYQEEQNPQTLINTYSQKIGKHLWQISIKDLYQNTENKTYKYTISVTYCNLSSDKAKALHLSIFKTI